MDDNSFAAAIRDNDRRRTQEAVANLRSCKMDSAHNPSYWVAAWHFHWRFWEPKDCIGGPVHCGMWATVDGPDGSREMSWQQVQVKRSMGLIRF